jgi:hypothetical protein
VFTTSIKDIPEKIPTPNEANNNTKNACKLTFAVIKIINTIATAKITNNIGPCTIFIIPLYFI